MKNFFLLCGLLLASINQANAQFILTSNEVQLKDGGEYLIMSFEDKTKEDLFDAVHQFAGAKFISPQDVISVSGKEQITFNGVATNIPWRNIISHHCSINFTITFLFKNNRIRVNIPHVNRIYTQAIDLQLVQSSSLITDGVFKKNGKAYSPQTKVGIESFFNNFIEEIKQYIDQEKLSDW